MATEKSTETAKSISRTEATVATAKILFALSGNRCAFADPSTGLACENELARPEWRRVRAQICHIRGERPGAARYDPSQGDDERRHFDNLILMCPNHHYEIDSLRPDDFSVEILIEMKCKAEEGAELLQPEFSEGRLNSIAEILSDDYHRAYGVDDGDQQSNVPRDRPSAPRSNFPVVTLAGEITPTPTDPSADYFSQDAPEEARSTFFRSVDTPGEAVAFVRSVVQVVSTPLTKPLEQVPTRLDPLFPDIRLALVTFPDLVIELANTSPRQWIEVAESWAARREQNS